MVWIPSLVCILNGVASDISFLYLEMHEIFYRHICTHTKMQDYVCWFFQKNTKMWWEGWGNISPFLIDGESSKETSTMPKCCGVLNPTPHGPKGDILICVF